MNHPTVDARPDPQPSGDPNGRSGAAALFREILADPRRASILVGAIAALVFAGSLANGFAYDDAAIVAGDSAIHALATLPARLAQPYWPSSFGSHIGNWRPATTALFGLTWVGSGGSPVVFHLVALLLHGIATALVVLVLAELMEAPAAILGGLLFAIHPVHVDAVANVVGTAEPFSAIFLLAAVLLHLRTRNAYGLPRALAVTVLYALAVLAKEGAVVLPLLLLLVDASRTELDGRGLARYVREKGALYVLLASALALLMLARWSVLGRTLSAPAPPGAEVLHEIPRIWTVAQVWPQYVRLLLFPHDLASDYATALVPIAFGWTPAGILGVVMALALCAGAWLAWRRGAPLEPGKGSIRIVGLAILWAGASILPVANVLFLSNILLAERTLYVASIGVVAAAGWVLVSLYHERPRVGVAAVVALLLLLTVRTVTRVPVWRSTRTVMTTLLDQHPLAGRGWLALANRLADEHEDHASRRAFLIAIGLLNSDSWACIQVGSRLLGMDRPRAARFFAKRAWKERPSWSAAPGLLAAVDLGLGRYREAAAAARAGTALAPSNPSMYDLLAQAQSRLGRPSEAVRTRSVALRRGSRRPGLLWILQARDLTSLKDTTAALAALDSARTKSLSKEEVDAWRKLATKLGMPTGPSR